LKGRDGISRDGPRGQVDLSLCWFHDDSKKTTPSTQSAVVQPTASTTKPEQTSTQVSKKPALKKKSSAPEKEEKEEPNLDSNGQRGRATSTGSDIIGKLNLNGESTVDEEISIAWDAIAPSMKDRKAALDFFSKQSLTTPGGRLMNKASFNKSLIDLGAGELSDAALTRWMKIIDPLNSKLGVLDYETFVHVMNKPKGGEKDLSSAQNTSQSNDEVNWKCSLCAKENEMSVMFCGACGRSRGKHVSKYIDALASSARDRSRSRSRSRSPVPIIGDLAPKKSASFRVNNTEEIVEEVYRITFGPGPIGLSFNQIDHGGGCLIITKVDQGSAAILSGVEAGDLIVEVNEKKLEKEFTEDDLFTLLTELPRPISIGFMRSNLFEAVTDLDSAYSGHSDYSADDLDGSEVELSPMTPDVNSQASEFFDSMMQQAALSPNTPLSSIESPTTAEIRFSEDSPGQVMEEPRLLKASSKKAVLEAHRADNKPSVTPPPTDNDDRRSPSQLNSMLELMQAEK
jgi:hypothetical protein